MKIQEQLQQALEQLEMAARGAELGIWNYDLASGKSFWNPQLYRLLGLEPREGPEEADRFFDFIHSEDRVGSIANLQAVLEQKGDHLKEEFRIKRVDGEERWLAARGRVFRDEGGRAAHICGINFDITDRKRNEQVTRLVQRRLVAQLLETERANEELSQIVYAVTHDLKGPLRAIRHYTEFLHEDLAETLTGEQKMYLEGLRIAVDQGDALIGDLLSFSRIGKMLLEAEKVDFHELVAEIRSVLDPSHEVAIFVQPHWPEVEVDRDLLRQILQNLMSNGIKFNTHAKKRIEIGWRPAENDAIEIVVSDNGIGIDPQYGDQIFRIFQRLHTERAYKGTGIGLAIVQKAAQMLGGAVRLESNDGAGSTFVVELPRHASYT